MDNFNKKIVAIIVVLLASILSLAIVYNNKITKNKSTQIYENITQNLFEYYEPFNQSEKISNGVKILDAGQGIKTNDFTSSSPNVEIKIKGSFTTSNASIKLGINKNSDETQYIDEVNLIDGKIDYNFTIDASNLNIYSDAKSFFVLINTEDNTGEILCENIEIYSYDNIREDNNVLSDEADTNLMQMNEIPSNILFIGNSLLLGIDSDGVHGGAFGMAATSPQNDYSYHVEQAIIQKNSNAEFDKLHVGAFEMAEDDTTSENYIITNSLIWTNKDLVIVQIGDNVNSEVRRNTFNNNFEKLISNIRTKSPNATVLCITGWYYNEEVSNTVLEACKKYECGYLNISSLYTIENKATNHVGEVVTYYDGSTTNIQETWSTHPYNTGMKAIADKIIKKLGI